MIEYITNMGNVIPDIENANIMLYPSLDGVDLESGGILVFVLARAFGDGNAIWLLKVHVV